MQNYYYFSILSENYLINFNPSIFSIFCSLTAVVTSSAASVSGEARARLTLLVINASLKVLLVLIVFSMV